MAEIIDYLFIFWVLVTVGTWALGSLYEKHIRTKQAKAAAQREHRRKLDERLGASNDWSPYAASVGGPSSGSSNYYDSNQRREQIRDREYSSSQAYSSNHEPGYSKSSASYSANNEPEIYGRNLASYSSGTQAAGAATGDFGGDYNYHYSSSTQSPTAATAEWSAAGAARGRHASDARQDQSIPIATGFSTDCVQWVNSILYLFYTQPQKYGPIITESVYRSLNEKLSNITSSSAEHGDLIVEFKSVNRQLSTRPELTNVRTENESDKSVGANCKIYNQRLVFDLAIQRARSSNSIGANFNGTDNEQQHYELTLENLEGKLKSVAMLSDKLIVVQFMEKPDTKILLRPKQPFGYSSASHGGRPLISEDNLVAMILQSLTQVVVDLYFGDDLDFPQYNPRSGQHKQRLGLFRGGASELKRQIKHDFFGSISSSWNEPAAGQKLERKVLIKLLRAKNINYNQNVTCLLELDQPHQQAASSIKQGSNPYWDEHFLFTLNEKSSDLHLELWDSVNLATATTGQQVGAPQQAPLAAHLNGRRWNKADLCAGGGKFLGLARFNLDELRQEPVQRVSLSLQARQSGVGSGQGGALVTDLSDLAGGELELELLLLEHSSQATSQTNNGGQLKKSNSISSLAYQQGDIVSVDRKLTPSGYVITTTTITKPTTIGKGNRPQVSQQLLVQQRNQSPISSTSDRSELDINLDGVSSQVSEGVQDLEAQQRRELESEGHRSRSRSRSRSFLRAIKKRFSFSRTRSRSMGETTGASSPAGSYRPGSRSEKQSNNDNDNLERASMDSRSRASSLASMSLRAKSVPASREPSEVPLIIINNKTRLSDTASAFTFAHPRSQLVIECFEPKLNPDGSVKPRGQVRHYLIPDDAANKSKWRKRGIKLHLFNEHQFVACHLAGSSTCHMCGKVFSRRPGKQGYRCRNCHFLSHKECHVKVDHNCPHAKKDGLKLEFIDSDPPANLVQDEATARGAGYSGSLQRHNKRPMKLESKSISMEVDDR